MKPKAKYILMAAVAFPAMVAFTHLTAYAVIMLSGYVTSDIEFAKYMYGEMILVLNFIGIVFGITASAVIAIEKLFKSLN